ncbi:hypothetical protein N1851_013806 [Merluccius polli]|uniref:ADGRF3/5-like N-terminal domain-containing protein n=1 Tax=Merluccius polli TaxID=89951 RepID=A0AA47P1F1_MERPO|nr:hypothetical protein N1851_013806 [Merluccius polli]
MSCEQHHTYSNTYNPYSTIYNPYSNIYNPYSNTYNSYSNIYNPYSNIYNSYSNSYNSYNTYYNTYNNSVYFLITVLMKSCACCPLLVTPQPLEISVEIEVGIAVSPATASEVVAIARQQLGIVSYPIELSTTVHITDANLTTGKSLNTPVQQTPVPNHKPQQPVASQCVFIVFYSVCYSDTNSSSRQCQCEDQYGWSCDQCRTYEVCSSNTTLDPCGCINGLPPDEQLCQPITTIQWGTMFDDDTQTRIHNTDSNR